jgi:glycosyltransferase involved in cell wall biosynthesis
MADIDRPIASARIAILVPCYNESGTIGEVIAGFSKQLPTAAIHVFDNNSTDCTAQSALEAGAAVHHEKKQGKGHVLASMLGKVQADYYILVDGDLTYPPELVHTLLTPLYNETADHVVGARKALDPKAAYRPLHGFGNWMVTFLVNRIFSTGLQDVMSGYRAFTREVAENVPILAGGFDVETEFTLQSLEKGFVIREVPVPYHPRPPGSYSKLSTFRDGAKVLLRIASILKDFRPFTFFGILASVTVGLSLLAGYLPIMDYVRHRYVYHVPLALLAAALGCISVGLLQTGIVLATLNARFLELHALRKRERMPNPPQSQSRSRSLDTHEPRIAGGRL